MEQLGIFAEFLKNYGAYAMASVFALLYALERRERRATQEKYEKYLVSAPTKMQEYAETHAAAVDNLERAFLRAGIETKQPKPKSEDN